MSKSEIPLPVKFALWTFFSLNALKAYSGTDFDIQVELPSVVRFEFTSLTNPEKSAQLTSTLVFACGLAVYEIFRRRR